MPVTGKQHIQDFLNKTKNFIAINSSQNETLIQYLYDLKFFLEDKEQILYDALGVHDIIGLNYLLKQTDITHHLDRLNAGGAIYKTIEANYTFQSKDTNLEVVEENIFDLFTELLQDIDADNFMNEYIGKEYKETVIYNAAMDALSDAFKNKNKSNDDTLDYVFTARSGGKSLTGFYKKNKNLIGSSTIKINLFEALQKGKIEIKDNHFILSGNPLHFSKGVEKIIKENLRPELMRRLNKKYKGKVLLGILSEQQIRDIVNNIIVSQGIILDGEDLNAAQKIAINGSAGGISGYLGELQARLYFKELFKGVKDSKIIETGADYIKSKGGYTQMDPADIIIKVVNDNFNIQVKNYAKDGAEWKGSSESIFNDRKIRNLSTAESFMTERLQIHNQYLLEFFGAATWQSPNEAFKNEPGYTDYQNFYQEFYNIFKGLKKSFDTFLPNIIRLITFVNNLEEDLQYENFYFQKGKIIPASAIVDGIIDLIQNSESKKAFTSSYELYPGKSHYTHEIPYIDNYAAFAKETKIQWSVSISFNRVLQKLGLN